MENLYVHKNVIEFDIPKTERSLIYEYITCFFRKMSPYKKNEMQYACDIIELLRFIEIFRMKTTPVIVRTIYTDFRKVDAEIVKNHNFGLEPSITEIVLDCYKNNPETYSLYEEITSYAIETTSNKYVCTGIFYYITAYVLDITKDDSLRPPPLMRSDTSYTQKISRIVYLYTKILKSNYSYRRIDIAPKTPIGFFSCDNIKYNNETVINIPFLLHLIFMVWALGWVRYGSFLLFVFLALMISLF